MKELELKLKELNQRLGEVNNLIKITSEFDRTELLSEKQDLLRKIDTLEKAQNVLLGIEL